MKRGNRFPQRRHPRDVQPKGRPRPIAQLTAAGTANRQVPAVAHVWLVLLVPRTVGHLDHHEAVVLVEASRPLVDLEGPQVERSGGPLLGDIKEARSDPFAESERVDIEALDPAGRERQHAHDFLAVERNPRFPGRDQLVPDVGPYLVVRVRQLNGGKRGTERCEVDIGDLGRVGRRRPTNDDHLAAGPGR